MSTSISSHITDIEQGTNPLPHRTTTTTTTTTVTGGEEFSDEESHQCSDEDETNSVTTTSSFSSSSCTRVVIMSVDEAVDLESGGGGGGEAVGAVVEKKVNVHLSKGVERDCRICHLSLDGSNSNTDSGLPIELGCCCKDGLGVAHKYCAEAWFKIRGNKTCEICGSIARNVVGVNEVEQMEPSYEANDAITTITQPHPGESRHFWQGHKFLNFLLACMVFAFVISWLFHFNVPS